MFDLFGSGMPLAARFFIAFLVVLALIGVTAWLVRRFGSSRLGGAGARGRQPRLAVIDAASVDGRRRLVLIRRDNIEHLLMIGGPTDVVIEPNIVRAAPARSEPAMRTAAPPPAAETAWPLQPSHEPPPVAPPAPPVAPPPAVSVAPPRAARANSTEEPWLPGEPGARPRPSDSLTGIAAELSTRLSPPELPPPAAARPEPVAPPPLEPPPSPQTDRNLAEMAQQLEAALRRAPEGRPPVTDPLAVPTVKAERAPLRDVKPRSEPKFEPRPEPKLEAVPESKFEPKLEPKFESKFDTKFDTKFEPKFEFKPEPEAKPEPAATKSLYDNLEEEMASLLGRPPGKS
jgi:flagellar protein FliO/FliZ